MLFQAGLLTRCLSLFGILLLESWRQDGEAQNLTMISWMAIY